MDLATLISRRAAYLQAEAAVLKRQEYTIEVDGGSRRVRYADLGLIREQIDALSAQIERAQNATSGRRRVRYIRSTR